MDSILMVVISDDPKTKSIVELICCNVNPTVEKNIIVVNALKFSTIITKTDFSKVEYVMMDADYSVSERNSLELLVRKHIKYAELYSANGFLLQEKVKVLKLKQFASIVAASQKPEPAKLDKRSLDALVTKEINYNTCETDSGAELDRLCSIARAHNFPRINRFQIRQKMLRLMSERTDKKAIKKRVLG